MSIKGSFHCPAIGGSDFFITFLLDRLIIRHRTGTLRVLVYGDEQVPKHKQYLNGDLGRSKRKRCGCCICHPSRNADLLSAAQFTEKQITTALLYSPQNPE